VKVTSPALFRDQATGGSGKRLVLVCYGLVGRYELCKGFMDIYLFCTPFYVR